MSCDEILFIDKCLKYLNSDNFKELTGPYYSSIDTFSYMPDITLFDEGVDLFVAHLRHGKSPGN